MNSPAENRHMVATGDKAPNGNSKRRSSDEAYQRMLLNYDDMVYAEAYGGVNIKNDDSTSWTKASMDYKRLPHRRHF